MNKQPIFDNFLPIGGTLEVSHLSQISSSTVLFVHLTVVDNDTTGTHISFSTVLFIHLTIMNNDTTGSPFGLAHDFLLPYFPQGGMKYCEISFDVGSQSKIASFHTTVSELISNLALVSDTWERIVFGISDHTDNTNGDPFVGYTGRKRSYVATPVDNVSTIIC